jgi:Na+/proline symporter
VLGLYLARRGSGSLVDFFLGDRALPWWLAAIGTGPGLVLILRWFWWRINACAELAAMLAGFLVGLATSVVPVLVIADFGARAGCERLVPRPAARAGVTNGRGRRTDWRPRGRES